jgi:hypothetical protein
MRNAAIPWLFFVALSSLSAGSQDHSIRFTGEASQDQAFRKSIGHGLDFVLMPASMGDGITGWTIKVSPQGQPSDPKCTDFAWVVTPPYHFQNMLYLDTSYATTAQEAVRASPREFRFVLNCADFKTERKRVELAIYPSTASKQEVDEAMAKLGSTPLGTGRLWIKDYRITPGQKSDTGVDLGVIHWIKFKVEIKFPAGPRQQFTP